MSKVSRISMAEETCWDAVAARDARMDDRFVFAVTTTGIYCRPSCPARRAQRRNIRFFATCAAAERAGFRACLRCRPNDVPLPERQAQTIAAACRALDSDTPPALRHLAAQAGLSAFHFHRLFKSTTGVTPKAYAAGRRAERLRTALATAASVTAAIYEAGYNSNSRVYERAGPMLGMNPGSFRRKGEDEDIGYAIGTASLGLVLVARSPKGICALLLGDDAAALETEITRRFASARSLGADADFARLLAAVIAHVEAPAENFALPLDIRGTLFQQKVWAALRAIPPGTTASYAEVARRIGAPKATRAVAQACAANTLAVAIPCHRVLRSDGALSGYRWGVQRKRTLLDKERPEKD